MKNFAKTVIINRAVPGSGKTSISKCITNAINAHGLKIKSHSTDDFFTRNNRYYFDINRLGEFHKQNQGDFKQSLANGTDVVICDNTNLQPWQTEPYTRIAREYGYRIIFLNFLPRELWKHVQSQIVTPEKPDAHEVPESRLVEFIRDFNEYNELLNPMAEVNPDLHRDFVWDNTRLCPVETGKAAHHFDHDAVVTIRPEDYQQAKLEIGSYILKLMAI